MDVLRDGGADVAAIGLDGRQRLGLVLRQIARLHGIQETEPTQQRPHRRRQHDQPQRHAQCALRWHGPASQQAQPQQRIGHQNVTLVEQHGVRGTQHGQPGQATQESRRKGGLAALGRRHLQGEAIAEQKREQQVELGFEEPRDQPAHAQIHRTRIRRVGHARAIERRRENADVHDQDAKERKAAQRVHMRQAPG